MSPHPASRRQAAHVQGLPTTGSCAGGDPDRMLANKEAGVSTHVTSRIRKVFRRDAVAGPVPDLDSAIDRTRQWLLDTQRGDGHWVGELEGDTILESEY